MSNTSMTVVALGSIWIGAAAAVAAPLELPSVIADHMVIQQQTPVAIWGWGEPSGSVAVEFAGQAHQVDVDRTGRWRVHLDPMDAEATPRTMTVRSATETLLVHDVLVGEVWLCSGQSNMVWTIDRSQNADAFKSGPIDARIRMFTVPNVAAHTPQERGPGQWRVADSTTLGGFSAVAYHFGRHLIEHIDVPIGLINSSWGGSTVEAWVDRPALERIPDAAPFLESYDQFHGTADVDPEPWVSAPVDPNDWETVTVPGLIEDMGHDLDGRFWFRRTIEIPTTWAGRAVQINLGAIDDNDLTYFNGRQIGATNNWQTPRRYVVESAYVTAGPAVIAVRVEDTGGAGGFSSSPPALTIHPVDAPDEARPLAGAWHLQILNSSPPPAMQHRPANLYNAKIHPLRHLALRGTIWYQGESNAYRPRGAEYFTIFPELIRQWRRVFDNAEMPFYFVQLPNFTVNEPDTVWRYPTIRQAQLHTLRSVPHTGMAVILELGEARDIHPRNKHDVGDRLARWALVDTYGLNDIVKSGPIMSHARFTTDAVHVSFDLYGSSLATRRGSRKVAGFEIAGADGRFEPAVATIDGQTVVVRSGSTGAPHRVRYAWKNNADDADLVNAVGLPASPFEARRSHAGSP